MKFAILGTREITPEGSLEKPSHGSPERFIKPMGVPHQIHTYAELRKQIHDDLRIQHPEWINPDGSSPVCDSYEVRLMETLAALQREDNRPIMAVSRRSVRQQENSRASLTF